MNKSNSQYSNIRNQNKNEILEDYVEAIQEILEIKEYYQNKLKNVKRKSHQSSSGNTG